MDKKLIVWIDKQSLSIDKMVDFKPYKNIICTIKPLDTKFQTIRIEIQRGISVKEYQEGYIGKYKNELVEWAMRFIQIYALLNNITVVSQPSEFQSNEEDLYRGFELSCQQSHLDTLPRPSGSTTFVYENLQNSKILPSVSVVSKLAPHVVYAIDWYNTGLIQTQSTNQFLHYFIPLEILIGEFVKKSGVSWKKEHTEKHGEISKFLKSALSNFDKKKLDALQQTLSEYSFIDEIKKYFEKIFSKEEIDNFWLDDSDITENGKYPWSQFRKISQYGIKENADIFNIVKRLYKLRNMIAHEGLADVESKDIFVIENILRRVVKRELSRGNKN